MTFNLAEKSKMVKVGKLIVTSDVSFIVITDENAHHMQLS